MRLFQLSKKDNFYEIFVIVLTWLSVLK